MRKLELPVGTKFWIHEHNKLTQVEVFEINRFEMNAEEYVEMCSRCPAHFMCSSGKVLMECQGHKRVDKRDVFFRKI